MARTSMSHIVHEAVIEVDQTGARGTTATAPAVRTACCGLETPPPEIYFDLDRDFAFLVCSGQHTFTLGGVVHEPKDGKEQMN